MKIRNDEGYVLFIVLLIIVVFSILATSFMTLSSTTTKQNTKIEEHSQSGALAEMGAVYFSNLILNELDEMPSVAEGQYILYLSKFKAEEITQKEIDAAIDLGIRSAYDQLVYKINDFPLSNPNPILASNRNPQYEIYLLEQKMDNESKMATIQFDSTGYEDKEDGNHVSITTTLKIDFKAMYTTKIGRDLISDPDPNNQFSACVPSESKNNSEVYQIKKCSFTDDKTFAKQTSIIDSTVKITGDANFTNKMNITDSTLYVIGNLIDPNGNNSLFGSKIHVSGNATLGNLNNSSKVTIEIMGDADLANIKGSSENVTICVHGKVRGKESNKDGVKIFEKSVDKKAFEVGGACSGKTSGISSWEFPILVNKEHSYSYN